MHEARPVIDRRKQVAVAIRPEATRGPDRFRAGEPVSEPHGRGGADPTRKPSRTFTPSPDRKAGPNGTLTAHPISRFT